MRPRGGRFKNVGLGRGAHTPRSYENVPAPPPLHREHRRGTPSGPVLLDARVRARRHGPHRSIGRTPTRPSLRPSLHDRAREGGLVLIFLLSLPPPSSAFRAQAVDQVRRGNVPAAHLAMGVGRHLVHYREQPEHQITFSTRNPVRQESNNAPWNRAHSPHGRGR